MNTTPLWVPLVVAAMGLVGTVAGTGYRTKNRSQRKTKAPLQRLGQTSHVLLLMQRLKLHPAWVWGT